MCHINSYPALCPSVIYNIEFCSVNHQSIKCLHLQVAMASLKLQNKPSINTFHFHFQVYYRVEESLDESIEESNSALSVGVGVAERDDTNALDEFEELEEANVVEDEDLGPTLLKGL